MSLADAEYDMPVYCTVDGLDYATNGLDRPTKTISGDTYRWGVGALMSAATAGEGTSGSLDVGTYKVHLVAASSRFGVIGNPYDIENPLEIDITATTGSIEISGIQSIADPQVDKIEAYRTLVGEESPFYYAGYAWNIQDGVTTSMTMTLSAPDSMLPTGDEESALQAPLIQQLVLGDVAMAGPFAYGTPPAKRRCLAWDGRVWMFGELRYDVGTVDVTDGETQVIGDGTKWKSGLVGKNFYVDGDDTVYTVESVDSEDILTISPAYEPPQWRAGLSGLAYWIEGDRHQLYFSEGGLPEYFPWTNALVIGREDATAAIGGAVINQQLFIWSDAGIYYISASGDDAAPYGHTKTASHVGTPAPDSIVVADGAAYFFGGDNFYVFTGESSTPFGDAVVPLVRQFAQGGVPYVKGCRVGDNLFWAVPWGTDEYHSAILKYNLRLQSWDSIWTGLEVYSINGVRLPNGDQRLFACLGAGGGMYVLAEFATDIAVDGSGPGKFFGSVTGVTDSSITDSDAAFPTDGRLIGSKVWIASGDGIGQRREIVSHDGTTLNIGVDWETNPDATSGTPSTYAVAPIIQDVISREITDGAADAEKVWKEVEVTCLPSEHTLGQFNVCWRTDRGTWLYRAVDLDVLRRSVHVNERGHSFNWRLYNDMPAERMRIKNVGYQARMHGRDEQAQKS